MGLEHSLFNSKALVLNARGWQDVENHPAPVEADQVPPKAALAPTWEWNTEFQGNLTLPRQLCFLSGHLISK